MQSYRYRFRPGPHSVSRACSCTCVCVCVQPSEEKRARAAAMAAAGLHEAVSTLRALQPSDESGGRGDQGLCEAAAGAATKGLGGSSSSETVLRAVKTLVTELRCGAPKGARQDHSVSAAGAAAAAHTGSQAERGERERGGRQG